MTRKITPYTLSSIIVLCIFILSCDLGVVSKYDGVIAAIVLSLLFPQYTLILLLAISVYQDSPGLSSWGWYLAFVFVAAILIKRNLRLIITSISNNTLVLFVTVIIAYSLLSSFIFDYTGIFEQAKERPYYIVGLLIYIMIISAFAGICELQKNPKLYQTISIALGILILHSIGITFGQIVFGPLFLSSSFGGSAMLESSQLIEASSMGIPRLTGTYITPNGFAFCGILISLLYYITRTNHTVGLKDAITYIALTLFFSFIAQSKALIIFSLLSSIAFSFLMVRRKVIRYFIVFSAIFVILALITINKEFTQSDFSSILSSFRAENIIDLKSFGYRTQAWSLVINDFTGTAWFFGTGLSHWPIFFYEKLPFSLSDPHTFILSYIGTFGVLGVIFFLYILYRILIQFHNASRERKFLLISLLLIFLIKDLVSIPYLLGNTPLTFLIWLLIFQSLTSNSIEK